MKYLLFSLIPFTIILGCPETPIESTGHETAKKTDDAALPEPDEPTSSFVCPTIELPPGLGGPVHAVVDKNTADQWRAYRQAREEERFFDAMWPRENQGRYRVEQSLLEEGCLSSEQTVDLGRAIFLRNFTTEEGFGRSDDSGHQSTSRFQQGHVGGPDARACVNCHWKGGFAGGGDRADNAYMFGDGDAELQADARNPLPLWGLGWVQLLAQEITKDLRAQKEEGLALLVNTGESQTISLSSKGISFGSLILSEEGQEVKTDSSGLLGVDADLVVKPFGWKGNFQNIRGFLSHSLQLHFGLQSEEAVAAYADGTLEQLDLGTDPSEDPDEDGVTREITEGQLTALELFLATMDVPEVSVPNEGVVHGGDPLGSEVSFEETQEYVFRWLEGADTFESIGCAGCHVPYLPLESTVYISQAPLSGSALAIDLQHDAANPKPHVDAENVIWVPVFSDFKRHRMGERLQSLYPDRGVAKDTYLTRRLMGLANTAPYLHDGSATRLDEAIWMHGGEGSEAKGAADAFEALTEHDKASLRVYLLSLKRAPSIRIR